MSDQYDPTDPGLGDVEALLRDVEPADHARFEPPAHVWDGIEAALADEPRVVPGPAQHAVPGPTRNAASDLVQDTAPTDSPEATVVSLGQPTPIRSPVDRRRRRGRRPGGRRHRRLHRRRNR